MLGESLTDAGGSGGRKENAPPFRKAADISQFLAHPGNVITIESSPRAFIVGYWFRIFSSLSSYLKFCCHHHNS